MERLRKAFREDAAAGQHLRYQVELHGESPGAFWLDVRDGRLELGPGRLARPDVTLFVAFEDLQGVLDGRENPDLLFMADRFRIEGELAVALRLRKLFRAPA